jgi:hypothetical protein
VDQIIALAQLEEGIKVEPSEAELREIAGRLNSEKAKAQKMVYLSWP